MCTPLQRRGTLVLSLLLGLANLLGAVAPLHTIRLRNGPIETAGSTAPAALAQPSASRLLLLQFIGPLQPAWRESLRAAGVDLLRYVPDDAFVARGNRARAADLRALPFVQFVGAYEPRHKVHTALRAAETNAVRVLLAPDANARDLLTVRRVLGRSAGVARSRFGVILHGWLGPAQLDALARSDAVLWIEAAPRLRLFDEIASKIVGGDDGVPGTRTVTQQLGFEGTGVTIAVADSGLNNGDTATMHPDLAGRVDAFFFYGTLTDAADEHSHGTHVAGIVAGNAAAGETDENGSLYGLGVAPGAHLVAQRIFDAVGNDETPPSMETLTRDAVRAGAVIGSNSWGDDTQGRYDTFAAEFDALVRDADTAQAGDQPYILEFSAGNAGPGAQTIGSPAVAKNIIATGASENGRPDFFLYADGVDVIADFSSRGPCEDGRIKPDVVAPGTWIASLRSASATDENAWLPISENYLYMGGTSQAGPHASGAAAVFVQYYRQTHGNATPSPALVKAALINSALDLDDTYGTEPTPNMDEGWGRVDLTQLIGSSRRYEFVDQTVLLTFGQLHEHTVVVASAAEPLTITLAYTDVPGFPAAIPALVNDLDLEVVAPDGRVYRGNQFDGGESVPDAPGRDTINNVEGVSLGGPLPGEYVVRVIARNVVDDARADTGAIDQDFALVASGDLPSAGVGVLFFDRAAYTAPAPMKLELIDFDLAGQSAVTVHLTSSTETNGEPVTLLASGSRGIFTNSLSTDTAPAATDGRLQVRHGDTIEATYEDAAPALSRIATAVADLVPPAVTDVVATNHFGRAVITWQTDEPATAVVRYGTNGVLLLAVTHTVLEPTHQVELKDLVAGATYQFLVVSADEAGNAATNDNQGSLFSFVAVPAKTALLVNAYNPLDPLYGTIEIPLTSYTDALDQSGVSYEVWDVLERGASPGTNDLRPFRVVLWRLNDNPLASDTLSPAEQNALTAYVNGGGSLFVSAMELLTRIGTNTSALAFRSDVLQVASFEEDAGVPSVDGANNDPITGGLSLSLDYSVFDSELLQLFLPSPDVSDPLTLTTNAVPIFAEPLGGIAGLRFPPAGQDTGGRVVFLSFPLDAVSETDPAPNNRASLLRNILAFLAPGADGLGTIALDSPAYTIPARITVEVGDSSLAGQGQATVTLFTDTATNGLTLSLLETSTRGIFRGSLTLVATTNPPTAGELPAKNGDVLRAQYLDASANSIVQATADVDTIVPALSNVSAEPDYEGATVSWDTSEPTDALVQFGESPFLSRTAYDAQLAGSHAVTLDGLRPDRIYYFQVTSRDAAGNTIVDDNGGQYYTFRTLQPIRPPWTDDLNNSGTNWTVYTTEGTVGEWQLGVPNNGWETEAQSPPNAWGSNLNGDPIDFEESYLISPAIDLSGGNAATLRFWQSYDFSDANAILEGGEVLLIENNVVTTLTGYSGDSTPWTDETLDLTPYTGHVIYLAWHFVYFSLESTPRPGWLIDDVSVTVSGEVRGTLEITNNLAQARFVLTGPVSRTGQGWSLTVTNVPLGEYVVTWSEVPFYQTPLPQTNHVDAAAPVVFQGVYSFADVNTNGISDAWEQGQFGVVAPDRTSQTDTDGDKASDYAEFIAGTNPNSADPNTPSSVLKAPQPTPQPDGSMRFDWASVPGHAYQVQASTNLVSWTPLSDWVVATTTTSLVVSPLPESLMWLFRLEVRP